MAAPALSHLSTVAFVSNFGKLDWAIVVAYLIGTVIIGVYANRYIKNMADYIVAGRNLKSYISVATMLGSEIGLVTVMYTAQKGFNSGFSAFHIGLAAGFGCLLVGITGYIVIPLRRTGVMTIPEYYGQRFGNDVRVLGGFMIAVAGVLNMGVFLKVGATFLTALTGLDDPETIKYVMVGLISLVLLYTILGGMVSVVITDYIQFIVLSFGMLFVCFYSVNQIGWGRIVDTVATVHRDAGFNPVAEGSFGFSYIAWMLVTAGIVSCAVWPTAVMRVCAAQSTRVVRRLYLWSSIGFMTRFIIPQFLGICALAYMWHLGGDDGKAYFNTDGQLDANVNQTLSAMPLFLSQILPTGIIGLVAAGMLAAFMSTHDSYLLCWASIIVEDVINPACPKPLATKTRLLLARIFIFVIGIFLLFWSLWYEMKADVFDYLMVSGAIYFTGAIVVLTAGLYWKQASRLGAFLSLSTGLLMVFGLAPVRVFFHLTNDDLSERLGRVVDINEAHIGLTTIALAAVLMIVGSLLFPDKRTDEERPPANEPKEK